MEALPFTEWCKCTTVYFIVWQWFLTFQETHSRAMTSRMQKYESNENLSTELPFFKEVNYESKPCTKRTHLWPTMGPTVKSLTTWTWGATDLIKHQRPLQKLIAHLKRLGLNTRVKQVKLQRVYLYNRFWSVSFDVAPMTFWRRQWHPTPVLLPGKSHGWRSLVGCLPWSR